MSTPIPKEVLTGMIAKVGEQHDDRVFDQHLAKRCREFDPANTDPVNFLRDLLDMCVYGSGCSDSMIRIFHVILEIRGPSWGRVGMWRKE